jgi:hypothetical protein
MLLWFLVALVFRRRFQFSLRSLMLLVVVVAIPCSWFATAMKAARRQHAAVEAIEKLGGIVNYDYQTDWLVPAPQPPAPAWLCERVGVDLLANVTSVGSFKQSEIGDAIMKHLRGFTQLQELDLSGTKVSDDGLEQLKGFTRLQYLCLKGTRVSDTGLEHLKGLAQLQNLDLSRTKVSDAGLEHLKGLTQLQWLWLCETKVSETGFWELQEALPNSGLYYTD